MKKKVFAVLSTAFLSLAVTSCDFFQANKGVTERIPVEYIEEQIDKESLNRYFLDRDDLYPSYEALKENKPNLLDNVKALNPSTSFITDIQILRFSFSNNGFLDGETFLLINGTYFHLGTAFGGFGVTEFVRRHGDAGHWLFFLYSCGSGIHQTYVGVFIFLKNNLYSIKDLVLDINTDYTFVLDDDNNSIDLYESSITPDDANDGFETYSIAGGDLALENIDDMEKELSPTA
jgi:hypothetical protein